VDAPGAFGGRRREPCDAGRGRLARAPRCSTAHESEYQPVLAHRQPAAVDEGVDLAERILSETEQAEAAQQVAGKLREALGRVLACREACEIVVAPILESMRALFAKCDSESVEQVLSNIILAGGGSQITGLPELLQKSLRDEGYEGATTMVPEDYRRLVARGALKIANNVREDQWQVPL